MTQPLAFSDQGSGAGRRFTRAQWIVGNVLVVALAAVLAAPSFGDFGTGIAGGLCFFTPIRAVAGLLEWYLSRQYAYRSLAVSHLLAVVLGVSLGAGPTTVPAAEDEGVVDGLGLGVFGYLIFSVLGLGVSAAVAAIGAARRGGAPPPVPERAQLRSWTSLFWLNTVLIAVVTLLIAPSMAPPGEPGNLMADLGPALLVALLTRLPGVGAEWWLTRRGLHRVVYALHGVAAVLTLLVALVPADDPAQELGLGGGVGLYLLLGSLLAWAAVAVLAPIGAVRRRVVRPAPASGPAAAAVVPHHPVYRATAQVPRRWSEPVTTAMTPPPPARPEPARKLSGESLTVLGFAFGLASLVQGYDGEQKLQTVVIALGVAVIGFAGYYIVNRR